MASDAEKVLLDGGAGANVTGAAFHWTGGRGVFTLISGTLGGSTVALQWSPDGSTWMNVDRTGDTFVTFTSAPQAGGFELPVCQIRAAVTGGAGIANLLAKVLGTRIGA